MKKMTISKGLPLLFWLCLLGRISAQDIGNAPTWNSISLIGGSGQDSGNDLALDADGSFYQVGTFNGTMTLGAVDYHSNSLNNGLISKFSPAGNPLWGLQCTSSNPQGEVACENITVDKDGQVLVSGYFKLCDLLINGVSYPRTGYGDLFLAKLNPDNGQVLWVKTYGESLAWYNSYDLLSDPSGAVYCMTNFETFKFSPQGDLLWMTQNFFDYENMALATANDKLYLAGRFDQEINIGGVNLTADYYGLFMAEIDPATGALSNPQLLAETLNYYQEMTINTLLVKSPDEVYAGGYFNTGIKSTNCDIFLPAYGVQAFVGRFGLTGCSWIKVQEGGQTVDSRINSLCEDADGAVWAGGSRIGPVSFGSLSLNTSKQGFALKIQASDGAILGLHDRGPVNRVLRAGQNVLLTGSEGYAMFWQQMNNSGQALGGEVFDNDGGYGQVAAVESDDSGTYLTANVAGKVVLADQVLNAPDRTLLVAKLNLKGDKVLWYQLVPGATTNSRTFGQPARLDKSTGKFYCFGSFFADLTFNGQTYPFSHINQSDYFIVQFNAADGAAGWLNTQVGTLVYNSITTDRSGAVIAGGTFAGMMQAGASSLLSKGNYDLFLLKMDASGNLAWAIRGGGAEEEYSCIPSTDAQNNIYVGAEVTSLNFDLNEKDSFSTQDLDGNILLFKLNPAGALQWTKLHGKSASSNDEGLCFPSNMVADDTGNLYMTGFAGKTNSIGNIPIPAPYNVNNFIAKFDPAGEPVWAKPLPTRRTTSNFGEMDIDVAGNLYCAASFYDTIVLGTTLVPRKGDLSARNLYVARFAGADGSLDWAKVVSGSSEAVGFPTGMAVHDPQSVWLGGYLSDILNFGAQSLSSASGTEGFLSLIGQDIMVSVQQPAPGLLQLVLYPNPAAEQMHWRVPESINTGFGLSLTDSRGSEVLRREIPAGMTGGTVDLPLWLPAGLYYVRLTASNGAEEIRAIMIE